MSLVDTIKAKPILYGGGTIVVVVALWFLLRSGGGSQTVNSDAPQSSVDAAMAVQQAQLEANAHGQNVAASLQANSENIAGQITLATIAASLKDHIAELEANIASEQINAYTQDSALKSTLGAQVQQAEIKSTVDLKQLETAAAVSQSQILANALIAQSNNQTATQIASINAFRDINSQQTALGVYAIDHQDNSQWWNPTSWF